MAGEGTARHPHHSPRDRPHCPPGGKRRPRPGRRHRAPRGGGRRRVGEGRGRFPAPHGRVPGEAIGGGALSRRLSEARGAHRGSRGALEPAHRSHDPAALRGRVQPRDPGSRHRPELRPGDRPRGARDRRCRSGAPALELALGRPGRRRAGREGGRPPDRHAQRGGARRRRPSTSWSREVPQGSSWSKAGDPRPRSRR